MKYFRIAILLSSLAWVDTCPAELPQYYFSNEQNSEKGDLLGKDSEGNVFDWSALHSEQSGTRARELDHLRLYQKENANWTFLWTRGEGDKSAYNMIIHFVVRKEAPGSVVLDVGFDDVFLKAQGAWPDGFWVSNESEWQTPFLKSGEDAGTCEINEELQPVVIPATTNKVYMRVRSLNETEGFVWFESGNVAFEKIADKDRAKAGLK